MNNKRIYLAGPDVFYPNQTEIFRIKKSICANFGFEGVDPLDTQIDRKYYGSSKAFALGAFLF